MSLLRTIQRLSHFRKYEYEVPLPSHPLFEKLYENPEMVDMIDKNQYFEIFKKEIYVDINKAILEKIILDNKHILELFFDAIQILNKNWNFLICKNIKVYPIIWSPGGSYNYYKNTATILIKTTNEGTPIESQDETFNTICHEIIHIGIEDCIVRKYGLSHGDKECLVDIIMMTYLHDLFPEYKLQGQFINTVFVEKITRDDIIINLPEKIHNIQNGIY